MNGKLAASTARSGASASSEIAVQALAEGVRTLVVIKNSQATHGYRFKLDLPPGTKLVASGDGGVGIIGPSGYLVSTIDPPWAKDANGRAVKTDYRIEGDTLVQHVGFTRDSAFPVVADPYKRNCGVVTCSFYATRTTTRNLKDLLGTGGSAAGIIAGALGCQALPQPAGVACAAVVVVEGTQAAYNVIAAANRGGCFVIRVNMALAAAPPPFPVSAVDWDNVPRSNRWCYA